MIPLTCLFQQHVIHYRISGSGQPVLLLHGFAEDSSIWDNIAEELSHKYKIILPDIPGSGKSPAWPSNTKGIYGYAEAMLAILKEEHHEDAIVIGHSMGGYIALAMAEIAATKIKGLGLFHSSAYADEENKKETRKKSIAFIQENGASAFLRTSLPGLFADAELNKAAIEALLQRAVAFSKETLIQYYEAMITRPDRTKILSQSNFPILFVMGVEDKAVPFSHSLQQSHLPSISHISILRFSAHMGMIEEADKSLLILTDFLQAIYV